MHMKKKNVEEKLSDLIHALQRKEGLSVKEIAELLSCNRQSVYNYIKRLSKRNYTIKHKVKNRTVYYSLSQESDSPNPEYYIPIDEKILRKYSIIRQLYKTSFTRKSLTEHFLIFNNGRNQHYDQSRIPIDIKYTYFNKLVDELLDDDEIRLTSNGTYQPTGRTIPILHHFTDDELFTLQDFLETLPEASPYHSQLQSIAKKLEIVETSLNMGDISDSNYLTYGRNHEVLGRLNQWMKKLSDTNYTEKLIRIEYRTRSDRAMNILFQTGLVIYSVEKAALYLLGKEFTDDSTPIPKRNTIIDMSTITLIKEADYPNISYRSADYQQIFSEMFSISLDQPIKVTVRFDLEANVKRKVQYLQQQRSCATVTFYPEDNQLEYTDTIRSLNDFASYLRQFGKSVHVIAPDELKEKMAVSVDRTLTRYEEENYD